MKIERWGWQLRMNVSVIWIQHSRDCMTSLRWLDSPSPARFLGWFVCPLLLCVPLRCATCSAASPARWKCKRLSVRDLLRLLLRKWVKYSRLICVIVSIKCKYIATSDIWHHLTLYPSSPPAQKTTVWNTVQNDTAVETYLLLLLKMDFFSDSDNGTV